MDDTKQRSRVEVVSGASTLSLAAFLFIYLIILLATATWGQGGTAGTGPLFGILAASTTNLFLQTTAYDSVGRVARRRMEGEGLRAEYIYSGVCAPVVALLTVMSVLFVQFAFYRTATVLHLFGALVALGEMAQPPFVHFTLLLAQVLLNVGLAFYLLSLEP
jgi:hypothetical protein